jgi:ABC-2 type transport system ATP-binding protein
MSNMATVVSADHLGKTYPGGVRALDDLSLALDQGEILGLLGPNGAGKSTTIKVLTTLTRPDSGTALVAGHDVLRHPERVRREIGVVAQRSGADPDFTGRENLLLQGRIYGLRGAAVKRRADELLERFQLVDAARRAVKTYSGGMQRRLDVALGLMHRPRALFLDEPTTGLDPEVRSVIWAEIARLAAEESIAVLLTTHYLDEADRLADRVVIVDTGRIVAAGTPDALKGELKGDAVHLEWQATIDEPIVRAAVAGLPGVREAVVEGRRLSVRVDDGAAAVPRLLSALDAAGTPAASATVARPSLDDVYLRHAGHRYQEVA